jgi:hypothetical protein
VILGDHAQHNRQAQQRAIASCSARAYLRDIILSWIRVVIKGWICASARASVSASIVCVQLDRGHQYNNSVSCSLHVKKYQTGAATIYFNSFAWERTATHTHTHTRQRENRYTSINTQGHGKNASITFIIKEIMTGKRLSFCECIIDIFPRYPGGVTTGVR